MKKLSKLLSIVMVVTMLAAIGSNVFASISVEDIQPNGTAGDAEIKAMGGAVMNIVTNVGMVLAVIIIAVIGIKYMMGSTSDKAEYKKSMIPYLVGAVLVFGASAIAKMVYSFGSGLTSNTTP